MAAESIPLALPDLGEREEELVLEVLRSGRLSLGPMLDRFERAFAEWLGVDDAVAVSNGTAGLHLSVRAQGWGPGDEVVTTPFSFVASANCLLYEDVLPVFCDIDPVTLNIDPGAVEETVGERTTGILPVHIFGYPAAIGALEQAAARHGLGIVEDACQALGAVDSEGARVGARGNLTTFAFYANKQLTTGEGGMVVPTDSACAERLRSERNQGRAPDMSRLDHDRLGFNYRLPDVSAAIGLGQLERFDEILTRRTALAARYRSGLDGIEGLQLPAPDSGAERRSWFVFVALLPDAIDRDETIEALAAAGVASKPYLPCIHLHPFYRERFGHRPGEFPVAERTAARALALPFFTRMTEDQVDSVCEALRTAITG